MLNCAELLDFLGAEWHSLVKIVWTSPEVCAKVDAIKLLKIG